MPDTTKSLHCNISLFYFQKSIFLFSFLLFQAGIAISIVFCSSSWFLRRFRSLWRSTNLTYHVHLQLHGVFYSEIVGLNLLWFYWHILIAVTYHYPVQLPIFYAKNLYNNLLFFYIVWSHHFIWFHLYKFWHNQNSIT